MGVVFKTHFKQTRMTLLQCQADDLFYKKSKLSQMQVNICMPNVSQKLQWK